MAVRYAVSGAPVVSSPPEGQTPDAGRCPHGGWAVLARGTYLGDAGHIAIRPGAVGGAYIESLPNASGLRVPLVAEADTYHEDARAFDSYGALPLGTGEDATPILWDPDDGFSRRLYLPLVQREGLEGGGSPWTTVIHIAAADATGRGAAFIRYVGTGQWRDRRMTCRVALDPVGDDGGCRVPRGFTGYATVRSSKPIAAVVERIQAAGAGFERYSIYTGHPGTILNSAIDLPLVVDQYWTGWTSRVRLLSLDGTAPVVRLQLIPKPGDSCTTGVMEKRIRLPEPGFTLDLGARGYYSPWPGGNPPPCFYGALRITADRPLTAIASLTLQGFRGDIEATYSAFPRPS